MRRTGHGTPKLTDQLHDKIASDRQVIETIMQSELSALSSALRQSSTAALASIESNISDQLRRIQSEVTTRRRSMETELTEIRDRPRRIVLMSAAMGAIIAAMFWTAPIAWMMWRMGGAQIVNSPEGRFLILPQDSRSGWTCHGRPCVKLKE